MPLLGKLSPNQTKSFYLQFGYVTRQMSYLTYFKNQSKSHDPLNMFSGTTAIRTHSTCTVIQFSGKRHDICPVSTHQIPGSSLRFTVSGFSNLWPEKQKLYMLREYFSYIHHVCNSKYKDLYQFLWKGRTFQIFGNKPNDKKLFSEIN
jgi:hypothetical protein